MYDNKKVVKQDYEKAFELYTKSCDIGNDALGCRNLGFLYIDKYVSNIDTKKAFLEGFWRIKKVAILRLILPLAAFRRHISRNKREERCNEILPKSMRCRATDNLVQSFEERVKLWRLTCGIYELLKQGSR